MEQAFDEFVHSIYGAVLDAGQWNAALANLANLAEAKYGAIMDSDLAAAVAYREVLHNFDVADNRRYLQEYAAIDPRIPLLLGHHQLTWISDKDHFDDAFRKRDRFYQELWMPGGYGESLCCAFSREGSRVGTALLARNSSQEKVSESVRKTLDAAVPHLDRAVRISRRFDALAAEIILSHNVLDALSEPLACALSDGRMHRANVAFEDILRMAGVVRIEDEVLHVQDSSMQSQFLRAIKECCRIADGAPSADPGAQFTLRIERATEPPCFITIAPLMAVKLRSWAGRPCALIRIDEPNRAPAPRSLEQAFALSSAEARLVSALCAGGTLADAAEKLGIALNTAKTQLAAAFSKTNTSRQSELVSLVTSLPPHR